MRLTAGGKPIKYPGDVRNPTSDIKIIKLHWDSIVSGKSLRYICMDVKYFYLITDSMRRYEYISLKLKIITDEFLILYNIDQYAHNGYVYAEPRKGMYVIPEAGGIANYPIFEALEPFGYAIVSVISVLWWYK